jgi:hypothetical protein
VERYVRRSGDAYPYPSGLLMSDDEDVGGLRLVGARPGGVRLVGVGQGDLPLPRRQSKL